MPVRVRDRARRNADQGGGVEDPNSASSGAMTAPADSRQDSASPRRRPAQSQHGHNPQVSTSGPKRTPVGDLAGLDGPVRLLYERIAGPAAAETPDLAAVGGAIVGLATDIDYMMGWVERLGEAGGSLAIHAPSRGPRLTIVRRPNGQVSTVHDHGTWVVVSPIAGRETHRRYAIDPRDAASLPRLVEVRTLGPSDVTTLLPPDDVHDHGHLSGEGTPAWVLIMTGEDQTRFARHEWDLATGRHRMLRPGDSGRWLAREPMPDA